MLQYTRQIRQRRQSAFELLQSDANQAMPSQDDQLALDYGHQKVDARALRRRLSDIEYDDEN